MSIVQYIDAIQAKAEDVIRDTVQECKPSKFFLLGKEIEMHYVCCLYRLRDREIKAYYNSNMSILPNPPQIIKDIQKEVERITEEEYTYVLINIYRDGTDYLGYHRDKESLDGPIASVSLGATRRFLVKCDETKQVTTYTLRQGDLVYMQRGFQRKYKHCVPKMSVKDLCDHLESHGVHIENGRKTLEKLHQTTKNHNITPVRVNLTFRY